MEWWSRKAEVVCLRRAWGGWRNDFPQHQNRWTAIGHRRCIPILLYGIHATIRRQRRGHTEAIRLNKKIFLIRYSALKLHRVISVGYPHFVWPDKRGRSGNTHNLWRQPFQKAWRNKLYTIECFPIFQHCNLPNTRWPLARLAVLKVKVVVGEGRMRWIRGHPSLNKTNAITWNDEILYLPPSVRLWFN